MDFKVQCKEEAIREMEQILESNLYKMVDFSLFDEIYDLKLNDKTKNHYYFVLSLYKEYLEIVKNSDTDIQRNFLSTLKNADIIDNQKFEKEDSFLIALYLKIRQKSAADEIISRSSSKIYHETLQYIHFLLMEGTSKEDNDNYSFRSDNYKFVGQYINNTRIIDYFPIDYKDIDLAVDDFLRYYNNTDDNEDNLLIKPFVIHGLLGALQVFDDGNTRLARLFQHVKLWKMTNHIFDSSLEFPAIYLTRSCYLYRSQSRKLISDIANNPNQTSWNNWINFNLNRMEEQIYYNENHLKELKRRFQK